MSSFQSAADVPLQVRSENSSSERRVSPAWTISHFKGRLEPITGIPSSCQRLTLKLPGSQPSVSVASDDEDSTILSGFPLQAYAEIYVTDARPASARLQFSDPSVPKYTMPTAQYESLSDSVLAWKKNNKLGRFDPTLGDVEQQQAQRIERDMEERDISLGARCRLLPPPAPPAGSVAAFRAVGAASAAGVGGVGGDDRRGTVAYIGDIPEIPGPKGCAWVGIALDEPVGKNDGTAAGKQYFECAGAKHGVFVRPERVEVGDFPVLDELGDEFEEM